jgi:hypothetical protein
MKSTNSKKAASLTCIITCLLFTSIMKAQEIKHSLGKKPGIAVVDFDTKGYNISQEQAIQFTINELIRLGNYEVMDKYEVEYIAKRDSLVSKACFSKACLSEFGKHLGIEKMLTGSIQLLGENVSITIRLLDVNTGTFEKTLVKEFLNIQGNELMMIRVTINELFGVANDADLVKKMTVRSEFESKVNNPYKLVLRADGPRIGLAIFSGISAEVIKNSRDKGGYNGYPYMFQFGYQFEKQYLNEGNFQALVEMIPILTGMDQGRIIPSFTFLNGLRNNKNGWEFAFGPTFNIIKISKGFYKDGKWYLSEDKNKLFPSEEFEMVNRPDSRGSLVPTAGFLFGFGKTFKSGKMNIPINFFIVPNSNGARFGFSFGWNGRERYQLDN